MQKNKFTTTIDCELLKQIKIRAIEENRTVASILEELIREYLKRNSVEK